MLKHMQNNITFFLRGLGLRALNVLARTFIDSDAASSELQTLFLV